jgi:hypothetical protein
MADLFTPEQYDTYLANKGGSCLKLVSLENFSSQNLIYLRLALLSTLI